MAITLLSHRYQIIGTLGKGGFGETFLAVDTHMPSARKCVIKQLKPAVQAPEIPNWLKERFAREAAILEELGEKHPQIPALYAYFSEGGNFYLVQEWIEGDTLTQIYQRQGNFSETQIQEILQGILPVLDYIHTRRIIHRDIKPDNIIMRASDGKPVLIDFGIVKEAVATLMNPDGQTAYSVPLGTPGYMASEQAAGRPVYSSDLYSLGLTLVFLLTGKTPQYLETDPRTGEFLWRKEAPDVDENLASLIDKTIRFHPRDRFASARQMLKALPVQPPTATAATIAVATKPSSKPTNPAPSTVAPEETEKQTPWAFLALSAFLIASTVIGGLTFGFILATKERSQPTPSPTPTPDTPEPQETSPPTRQPRPRIKRSPQPQPSPSPTPEATPTPTPTPEPSPKATPTPEANPTPQPTNTPIPEPTQVVPIPVEPPPQSAEPIEETTEPKEQPDVEVEPLIEGDLLPQAPPAPAAPQKNESELFIKPNNLPSAPVAPKKNESELFIKPNNLP